MCLVWGRVGLMIWCIHVNTCFFFYLSIFFYYHLSIVVSQLNFQQMCSTCSRWSKTVLSSIRSIQKDVLQCLVNKLSRPSPPFSIAYMHAIEVFWGTWNSPHSKLHTYNMVLTVFLLLPQRGQRWWSFKGTSQTTAVCWRPPVGPMSSSTRPVWWTFGTEFQRTSSTPSTSPVRCQGSGDADDIT